MGRGAARKTPRRRRAPGPAWSVITLLLLLHLSCCCLPWVRAVEREEPGAGCSPLSRPGDASPESLSPPPQPPPPSPTYLPLCSDGYARPGKPVPQPEPLPGGGVGEELLRQLQHAAKYSAISYCDIASVRTFNCTLCQEDAALQGTTHVQTFHSARANLQGFTALDQERALIVIAFRGSASNTNTLTDLNFLPSARAPARQGLPPAMGIHAGFFDIYSHIHERMSAQIARLHAAHPNYTLLFTGHSMGGSYASIAVVHTLHFLRIPPGQVQLITFGQPRTGNPAYVRYLHQAGLGALYRVTNALDPVVHLPPRWLTPLRHHGREVFSDVDARLRFCDDAILDVDGEDQDCANRPEFTSRFRNLLRAAGYLPFHRHYVGVGQGRLARC